MIRGKFRILGYEEIENYRKNVEGINFLKSWLIRAKEYYSNYKIFLLQLNQEILKLNQAIFWKSSLDEQKKLLEEKIEFLKNRKSEMENFASNLKAKIDYLESILAYKEKNRGNLSKFFEMVAIALIVPIFLLMLNYYQTLSRASYYITGSAVYPINSYNFTTIAIGIFILISFIILLKKS